jgi:GNAT superfamily N-acetyltransferase
MQGRGVGERLLFDAIKRAWIAAQHVGSALIVVHALDDEAERFYEKYGFVAFADIKQGLFLPTATVASLIS